MPFASTGPLSWPVLLLLAQVLVPRPAPAQERGPATPDPTIRFQRPAVEAALPQSSVYLILEDRDGFLWFGTREGLGRWDGYEMRTWKSTPFSPDALPGNLVRRLVQGADGDLWVTAQPNDRRPVALARIRGPDHGTVERFEVEDAVPVLDGEGRPLVVDPEGIHRFEEDGFRLVTPLLSPGSVPAAVLADRRGTLWVGTLDGEVERYPATGPAGRLKRNSSDDLPRVPEVPPVSAFFEDARGTLWVLGQGLRQVDWEGGAMVRPPGLPPALAGARTTVMLEDPRGWFWLGTLDGVYRFDAGFESVERFSLYLPGDVASQNWVLALHLDRSGSLWVGTPWGLHRHDPVSSVFTLLEHDSRDAGSMGSGLVLSLLEDDDGAVWVGTLGGGLNRLDPSTGRVRRFRLGAGAAADVREEWVWSLARSGEVLWVGTESGLLELRGGGGEAPVTLRRIALPPPEAPWTSGVMALLADGRGGVWMRSGGGLVHRAADGTVEVHHLPHPAETHQLLAEGDDLWAATSAGLVRYSPSTGQARVFVHTPSDPGSLSNDVVFSLFRDSGGTLWAGTASGLNRLEADSTFFHQGIAEALPSAAIYSITEDERGHLWMGTNRGLLRLDPSVKGGNGFRVYDGTSGVGNLEFNRNAVLRVADGTVFFGGDRGVTRFTPSHIRDGGHAGPVVVTRVLRSNRDGTREERFVGPEGITLAPSDYTVTVELAALNFIQPQRSRYEVQLEGFDPTWVPAGTARRASYTNLPHGRYTFRARAANADGVWSPEVLEIPVVVRPWIWETLGFRAAALTMLLAGVGWVTAAVQRGRYREELEEARRREALEQERDRISRDMHDEVGASLTEIALLSQTAAHRSGLQGGAPGELERIAVRSRETLRSIGEIVWALDPRHDRPTHLVSYLREYAADFLEGAGLDPELHFEEGWSEGALTSDFRRNVFLVLKEALTNVVKHAGAGTVRVTCTFPGRRMILQVEDDGVGGAGEPEVGGGGKEGLRPGAGGRGGRGLPNMQGRAAALAGRLDVVSVPGKGTTVLLDVPLPGASGAPGGSP